MQPLIWLGILALLLVVEAITAGLTTIWFAGGALVAAIACYADHGEKAPARKQDALPPKMFTGTEAEPHYH